jgi:tetratricopeptide (TPR) repeat protein
MHENKSLLTIVAVCFCVFLTSCQTKADKAFNTFNEGVSLSLDAADAQGKGDFDKSAALNKKAIEKFKETLKIDSNHKVARSALAHSLYLDRQFREAIDWYEKANEKDTPVAVNFLELGLCKVNLGQVKEGRETIEKALKLDTSKELRTNTALDLTDIGTRAFSFGKQYLAKGDEENGKNYQHFAIAVLMMAFDFDNSRKDISAKITQYADEIHEKAIADQYRSK